MIDIQSMNPTILFFFILVIIILFLFMGVLCACISVHHIHVWSPHRPKEGINSPETVGKDNCEPPCRSWKPNPGPLQEKLMLLTIELSLQTLISSFSPMKHIAAKGIYMYISLYSCYSCRIVILKWDEWTWGYINIMCI